MRALAGPVNVRWLGPQVSCVVCLWSCRYRWHPVRNVCYPDPGPEQGLRRKTWDLPEASPFPWWGTQALTSDLSPWQVCLGQVLCARLSAELSYVLLWKHG